MSTGYRSPAIRSRGCIRMFMPGRRNCGQNLNLPRKCVISGIRRISSMRSVAPRPARHWKWSRGSSRVRLLEEINLSKADRRHVPMNFGARTAPADHAPSHQTDVEKSAAARFLTRNLFCRRSERASAVSSAEGTAPIRIGSFPPPRRARHAGIRQRERPASPFAATARRRAPCPGRQDLGNGRWLLAAITAYLGWAMPLDFAISALLTLFVVVAPVGLVPTFLAVPEDLPRPARRSVAVRSSIIAGAILIGTALIGDWLLQTLSISLPAFRLAGGVVVFSMRLEM